MTKNLVAMVAVALAASSCSGRGPGSQVLPASDVSTAGHVRTASNAPAGWATTSTQAYTLAGASDLGPFGTTHTMTIRVGLALRNRSQLTSLLQSRSSITPAQFLATYAPAQTDVQAVTSYLQSKGFKNVTVEPNNLLITATGSVGQVESAFDTQLHQFTITGETVYANTAPAYVPASLAGKVVAVLGLTSRKGFEPIHHLKRGASAPVARTSTAAESPCSLYGLEILAFPMPVQEPQSPAGCLRNYAPSDYWAAYDANRMAAAYGVPVAIMAEGNVTQSVADLRVNEQGDGIPQVPVTVVPVGVSSPDTSGDDEWTLDMTASSGMARGVKQIYLYDTASLTDSDIALEFNRWVTDDHTAIANASFGGCEFGPYLDGSMVLDDEIFAEAAAEGKTLFASTGDTGSFCSVGNPNGVPGGVPLVEYPAASPYVVAVGGTTLLTQSDGAYQGEASWYAGGGGVSQFEAAPSWQQAQPVNGTGVLTFRGLPDIAMDADLQTGMLLYLSDQGGWTIIGGTSLASPLAAGSWARVLQSHPQAGFAASRLYATYAAMAKGSTTQVLPPTTPIGPGFHDVIVGSDGAYAATPGYDYTTGLGTLDLAELNAHLH